MTKNGGARAGLVIAIAALSIGVSGCSAADPQEGSSATGPVLVATSEPTALPPTENSSPPVLTTVPREASASPSTARVGERITVRGSGWPATSVINAVICGNNALNGQVDCDPASGAQDVSDTLGDVLFEMVATVPPLPCPCVVRVSALSDAESVSAPLEIIGADVAEPQRDSDTVRALDVSLALSGGPSAASLFGVAAARELTLVARNSGTQPLLQVPVSLTFGSGTNPTDPVVIQDVPNVVLPDLQPGETGEVRVPIEIPAIAAGKYTARASFVGLDTLSENGAALPPGQNSVSTTTTTYPWGLLIVAWLLLQIPLLGLYKRRQVIVVDEVVAQAPHDAGISLLSGATLEQPWPSAPQPPPGFRVVSSSL